MRISWDFSTERCKIFLLEPNPYSNKEMALKIVSQGDLRNYYLRISSLPSNKDLFFISIDSRVKVWSRVRLIVSQKFNAN